MSIDMRLQPWGSLTAPLNTRPATPTSSIDPRCLDLSFSTANLSTPSSCASSAERYLLSEQEADLERLLCLTQCSPERCDNANEMADFLASFNFSSNEPTHSDESQCNGLEDVQTTLGREFDLKVTRTRAEHIVETFTIATKAQLTLRLNGTENESLQRLGGLDPSLGGLSSRVQPAQQDGNAFVRVLQTSDATTNQGQDPVVQKLVAQQLINAINAVDDSTWILRDLSSTKTGWVFSYVCRDSFERWKKYSKPTKDLHIAEYSLKEPDGVAGERPSFDCRGALTISFLKRDKTIAIKYAHTPFHRTVAQVYDIFRPPPRQVTLPPQPPKTPKTPRTPASGARKRKESNGDSSTNARSRPQKKNGKTPTQNGHSSQTPGGEPSNAINVETLANVASEAHAAVASTEANDVPSYNRLMTTLAPPELARRRETANKLLSDAGIDVSTLSSDQFNIFSNQPPNLQQESIELLLKYGAERLRIVHPEPRKSPAPAIETPVPLTDIPGQSSPSRANNASKRSANRHSEAAQDSVAKKLGKSRLVCTNCKNDKGKMKSKCSKDRPSCSKCIESGLACEYPPAPPRKPRGNAGELDNQEESALDADHESAPEQDVTMNDVTDDHEAVLSLAAATAQYSEPQTSPYQNQSTSAMIPTQSSSSYPDPPSNTAAGRRSRAITEAVQSSQAAQQSAANATQVLRSSSLALPQASIITTPQRQPTQAVAQPLDGMLLNMQQQLHVMPQRSPAMTAGQRAALSSAPYQRTPPPRNNNAGHAYPAPPDTSANDMYANRLPTSRSSSGMSLMEQRAASHLVDFQNSQPSGQSWFGSAQSGQNPYNNNGQQASSDERIAYEPFSFQKHSNYMQETSPQNNKALPGQRRS